MAVSNEIKVLSSIPALFAFPEPAEPNRPRRTAPLKRACRRASIFQPITTSHFLQDFVFPEYKVAPLRLAPALRRVPNEARPSERAGPRRPDRRARPATPERDAIGQNRWRCHSRESRSPDSSADAPFAHWIPAFAVMTRQRASWVSSNSAALWKPRLAATTGRSHLAIKSALQLRLSALRPTWPFSRGSRRL